MKKRRQSSKKQDPSRKGRVRKERDLWTTKIVLLIVESGPTRRGYAEIATSMFGEGGAGTMTREPETTSEELLPIGIIIEDPVLWIDATSLR